MSFSLSGSVGHRAQARTRWRGVAFGAATDEERDGTPFAAVLLQVRHQRVHALEVDRVDQRPAIATLPDHLGRLHVRQMERQRRGRHAQLLGDRPGAQPVLAGLHQQTMHLQTRVVRQRAQRQHRPFRETHQPSFDLSSNIETTYLLSAELSTTVPEISKYHAWPVSGRDLTPDVAGGRKLSRSAIDLRPYGCLHRHPH